MAVLDTGPENMVTTENMVTDGTFTAPCTMARGAPAALLAVGRDS
jgi:hypothetical protein